MLICLMQKVYMQAIDVPDPVDSFIWGPFQGPQIPDLSMLYPSSLTEVKIVLNTPLTNRKLYFNGHSCLSKIFYSSQRGLLTLSYSNLP
jgi:hypothetical protein